MTTKNEGMLNTSPRTRFANTMVAYKNCVHSHYV